jgi:plastocyanin
MMKGRRSTYLALALALVSTLGLAACGNSYKASSGYSGITATLPAMTAPAVGQQPQSGAQVVLSNTSFQPAQITVPAGTTVTWINRDPVAHTVTAGTRGNPSGLFDSGQIAPGGTFSFTFDQAGTYNYFCAVHNGMDGTVIVQ